MLDLNKKIIVNEKWKQNNGKYQCPICKKEYTKKGIITHIYRSHTNKKFFTGGHGHYKNIEYKKKMSQIKNKMLDEKNGKYIWFEVKCNKCNIEFCVKERENLYPQKEKYFCNIKCANSRRLAFSKETVEKIRKKSISLWQNEEYVQKQLKNNKKFFTSKGEEDIKKFFKTVCPDDEWTSGGNLKQNGLSLIRDLFSKKLKVCIEYDGVWHFKDIYGQLKIKQKKDRALEKWCLENGYKLIRIDEELYKQNKIYWKHLILDEVYNGEHQIIKFGNKY